MLNNDCRGIVSDYEPGHLYVLTQLSGPEWQDDGQIIENFWVFNNLFEIKEFVCRTPIQGIHGNYYICVLEWTPDFKVFIPVLLSPRIRPKPRVS